MPREADPSTLDHRATGCPALVVSDAQGHGDAGVDEQFRFSAGRHREAPARRRRSTSAPDVRTTSQPSSVTTASSAMGRIRRSDPSISTSTSPGTRPRRSRSTFGTTILPALSMVARIPAILPFDWHRLGGATTTFALQSGWDGSPESPRKRGWRGSVRVEADGVGARHWRPDRIEGDNAWPVPTSTW